jgi:hypothetical protein
MGSVSGIDKFMKLRVIMAAQEVEDEEMHSVCLHEEEEEVAEMADEQQQEEIQINTSVIVHYAMELMLQIQTDHSQVKSGIN